MENWSSDAELGALWFGAMSRFAEAIALEIDEERAAGKLPEGLPSRQIATALVWSTERCLYLAGRGLHESMTDEAATVETLATMWAGTLRLGDASRAG